MKLKEVPYIFPNEFNLRNDEVLSIEEKMIHWHFIQEALSQV